MNDRLISGLFHFFRLDLKNCPVRRPCSKCREYIDFIGVFLMQAQLGWAGLQLADWLPAPQLPER
jgi:hypothetical protein